MDEDSNYDNLIDSNQQNDNQLEMNKLDKNKFNNNESSINECDLFLNENSNNESNNFSIDNDESNLNNQRSILETSDMDGDNSLNDLSNLNEDTVENSKSILKDDNQSNISNNLIKDDQSNDQIEIKQNNDQSIDQNKTDKIKGDKKSSNKSFNLVVHLLNGGKFECPITSKSIGKEVFIKTCDYLILREHEYFGLTYRNAENIRIWINLDKKIFKQIKDNPNSLHFEVKFFPEPADLKENITRFFICLQIRNNIIEEKIICSNDNYALLGSYLVQSEFGNYDPEKHDKDNYLNEFKFAPKPTPELIKQLHELHKERKGLTAPEAELQFLQNAKRLSIYGLDFYPATDLTNNESIKIGVCSSGLSVYKDSKCLESYPWLKINKISYNVDNFSIRVKPNGDEEDKQQQDIPQDNVVNFKLCSAKAAYDLWKITVEHHTFFKSLSNSTLKSNNKSSSSKKNSKDKSSKSKHHHHHHHHHKSSSKIEKDSKSKIRSSKKDKSKKENIKTSSKSKPKLNDNNLKLTKLERTDRHDKTDKLNNSDNNNKHRSRKEEINNKDQKEDKHRDKNDYQSREYLKDRNRSDIQLKDKKEEHHSSSRHKRKKDNDRNQHSINNEKSILNDSRERKRKLNLEEDKLNHHDDKINNRRDEYRELKRRDEYEQKEKERERNYRSERDHRVERSPNRRSPNRRSPNRRSLNRRSLNRRSPNRRSLTRRSPDRRSPNRRSPDRRSPNRRSLTRRSPDRRSLNRRSPNRRSPNRRSPNHRSLNRRSLERSTNRDKSNSSRDKHKKHKHKSKHSRHDNERSSDKKINLQSTTLSIAESHYQNLEMESIKYLDEKQKSKEERSKHKRSRKSSVENKSPLNDDQQCIISSQQQQKSNKNESISKKILNHFQADMDLEDDKSNDNLINNNKQNDNIEQIITQSKPGPPSKKDVKLNSKSNVEFDIFWDNEKSNEELKNKSSLKNDNQILNKDKDNEKDKDSEKDKNFIPRVLLNGNESNKPTTTFKFEIKSNRSTNKYSGPKTPPDDFNIFETTNTLSNQSIPTPTQDESQLCLNSNDKFNNSLVDSLNDNSVRSLSPAHSMQSEKSQLNDNLIKNNNLSSLNNQNSSTLNNHKNINNKLTNNSTTKYEIYDPEAPLESPDQKLNSFNSKNNYNLFNSNSCNKQINGDNFADMEIDSPISPSKPISPTPLNQSQPKPSTSNLSSLINQQQTQTPALKSADLKLVLDHLIKAAQLQQKKNGQQQQQQQSNNLINSPFKKQQTNRHLNKTSNNNLIMNNDLEDDDMPSSATELNLREKVRFKYIKKLNRQERVVDELKCHLKPYYQRKEITKDEYKNIMRKAVPKICHSKTGEINPAKIKQLVENYIKKEKHARKAK